MKSLTGLTSIVSGPISANSIINIVTKILTKVRCTEGKLRTHQFESMGIDFNINASKLFTGSF
jgi:hypothetical protein